MSKKTRRLDEKTKHLKKEQTKHLAQGKSEVFILTDSTVIDSRFNVVEELSQEGGEADILLCEDIKSDNQKVVVKLYRGNFKPKTEILDKLKRIKHENIIRLIDYGSWNNRFYEVMEYAEGGSLAKVVPFTESYLIETIIPKILNGLKFCHSKGIIHRDLKPTNIYYRTSDKTDIVIGDFGISSILCGAASVKLTSASRSQEYAAPEIFSGHIGKEVDYYALGITLLFLLTGKSPFFGITNESRIMFIHLSEKIELPENCSDRFKMLIRGLLVKERKNRWGAYEIESWLRGEDVKVIEDKLVEIRSFHYKLGEKLETYTIKGLARLLYENPEIAKEHIGRGLIARTIEEYDQSLALKILNIQESAESIHLAYLEIIYTLDSTLPYRLDKYHEAKDPEGLALLIDESYNTWEYGQEQLYNQSILIWLKTVGYKHIIQEWDKVKSKFRDTMDQGLEFFLHLLKPDLAYPVLEVSHKRLRLGGIERNKTKNASILISNIGRGFLYGTLEFSKKLEGVSISKHTIELNQFKKSKDSIKLTIDTGRIPAGQLYSTNLNFKTNTEKNISIPVSFRIIFPFSSVIKECLIWGIVFAFYFFIVRLIISATGHTTWLNLEFKNYLTWNDVRNMIKSNSLLGVEFFITFIVFILLPLCVIIWQKVYKVS